MKDRFWQAVHDALRPLLNDADVVLAPRGDWPRFPCASGLYDSVIEIADCTLLILHKGLLTNLPNAELRKIANEWQWVFANEVFIVLSRHDRIRKDVRSGPDAIHCRPLDRFLSSASLRKRRSKIIYLHVPKTGGTSMWASLTRAFPSHVYYANMESYLRNPPTPEEYDLIGLHFSPTVLLPCVCAEDWVIGMVRHPAQRFLSGFIHFRRDSEDPETFTVSARAMRDMELTQYLATDFGRVEARLQLITFGRDYRQSLAVLSDQEMLQSAVAFARRENVVLAPSERSHECRDFLAKRLSFRPGALGYSNANTPAMYEAHSSEFSKALGLINSMNACEREFYDFVCQSFTPLGAAVHPRRRISHAGPWGLPKTDYLWAVRSTALPTVRGGE